MGPAEAEEQESQVKMKKKYKKKNKNKLECLAECCQGMLPPQSGVHAELLTNTSHPLLPPASSK